MEAQQNSFTARSWQCFCMALALVSVWGCVAPRGASLDLTMCGLFNYSGRTESSANGRLKVYGDQPICAWVERFDVRGGVEFDSLPYGIYSPAVALLLARNAGGKDICLEWPWGWIGQWKWKVHVKGYASERVFPMYGCRHGMPATASLRLAPGETVAMVVGMTEVSLADYVREYYVEYKDADISAESNRLNMPGFAPKEAFELECAEGKGCCPTVSVRCSMEESVQNAASGLALNLVKVLNMGNYGFQDRAQWPILLARADSEGFKKEETSDVRYVLGFAALIATNTASQPISVAAFNSGKWRLRITYKSGDVREVDLLPIDESAKGDRLYIKPGQSLAVLCGCSDVLLEWAKVSSFAVSYIDAMGEIMSNSLTPDAPNG